MTGRGPLVVVGDTLLDEDIEGTATRLSPDAPAPVVDVTGSRLRPGGAGLAAALAAGDGRDVLLVTALGDDEAGDAVRRELRGRVRLVELPLDGTLPVKTRVLAGGRPVVRVDRGGGTPGTAGAAVREALEGAAAILVADYGRRTADAVRDRLAAVAPRTPLVWDPHPKGGAPVPGARLVTPNAAETRALCPGEETSVRTGVAHADRRHTAGAPTPHAGRALPADEDASLRAYAERGAELADRWRAAGVAVTLGERGALLTGSGGGTPMLVPAPYRAVGDPCGAGDCFAAATVAALADGALPEEAVQRAVAEAAAFVSAGGAGNPALWRAGHAAQPVDEPGADAFALVERVRARGGTVVATGGCFDLLHAGHVGLLESARRIGDCLIVCLNSDASLARRKGPGRPLTPQADRARVLAALGSVDAVVVFEEDTPEALLRRLRPDVWVKGGDYAVQDLPEAEVLRAWGGQAVVLPYLDGRSTTLLARRAARAAVPVGPSKTRGR
ncbi:D-glycero-beta-D-manno-heptose 1-phosphate adenylyltransferase [Streptomyces sp. DSM 40750]|uniref:D-glycero-beta-D-manno-heptose 1-phosphate adenylyltransferase n=1 Tax=Streptomyces sp. DSM 40750 TaxID=2801030 RepID=UPI00214B7439|nr:D-glycero-beta-D-manno-heptose 1-phosphate adenylyltransferase [Streptomyces sp. DSM 40750]UUU20146.1 D-glycero-beta-D-manno-heptose 1-phosphate adenylyltransferase [Streptomyces sp. DSM 40750]